MTGGNRLSGVAAPLPGAALYAAKGGSSTTSNLYTLDPATAAATSVGATGFGITGLAVHPSSGVLYGVTNNNSASNPRSLITVDTTTGAGTLVGATGVVNGIADIAFRSDGVLYGYGSSTHRLYTINLATGTATQVSATTISPFPRGFGMDFDSTDLLFVCPFGDNGLYVTVDETTAVVTNQVTLSGAPGPGGLSVSAASFTTPAVFWATLIDPAGSDYLITINTSTGAITTIGVTLADVDAIAWATRATAGAPHPN